MLFPDGDRFHTGTGFQDFVAQIAQDARGQPAKRRFILGNQNSFAPPPCGG